MPAQIQGTPSQGTMEVRGTLQLPKCPSHSSFTPLPVLYLKNSPTAFKTQLSPHLYQEAFPA